MRRAHAIATRAAALAIIAGTGLTPLLVPVAAHADTTSTQPTANTNDKNETHIRFEVDKTRTFEYDGTHKTITCLSADYPKEVTSWQSSVSPDMGAAVSNKLDATDTTTTIDGRTIKGKSYTFTTWGGDKLTLNCYKAGDFFANLKISWNGVQATDFNPYGPDGIADKDTNPYHYSSGTATINTSMTHDEIKKLAQSGADLDFHIEGLPTGWTAKSDERSDAVAPGNEVTQDPNSDAFTETTTYEYTNPDYPGNTYHLAITQVNTAPQPTIQATDAPAPAPADTPQLVQTGVEQAGAATALLASAAIAANTIARRKRK